jgi:hypothetical protein
MKTAMLILSVLFVPQSMNESGDNKVPDAQPFATTCFSSGEQISGTNKICYYDCLGSQVAINVKSYELCPLTIKR